MELLKNTNFDFISKHRTGFVFSAIIIVIGLVFLVIHQGPNFGIDFRGGVKIQAKFNRAVTEAELQTKLTEVGYERAKIQIDASKNEAFVSMGHRPEFQQQGTSVGRILTDTLLEGGDGWQALAGGVNISEVGPSVGRDLKLAALWSVLGAIAILLIYISWRFEFRFAIGAIAALVHDVLITLGVFCRSFKRN